MPTYLYQCKDCGHDFEKTLTLREHEHNRAKAKPTCPKCKSERVKQRPVVFQAVTEHKA